MIRRRYLFTGQVQGVGFRWRAKQAANLCGCTGWARNLWDGTVEMELQGTPAAHARVLLALRSDRYIRITHLQTTPLPLNPEETGFRMG